MLDTLSTVKDEIQIIDTKVENDLNMIRNTLYDTIRPTSAQPSHSNKIVHEEQKVLNDDFLSQKENSVNDNVSLKIHDKQQIRSYKENIKSINKIVSKEIENDQMEHSFEKNQTTPKHLIEHNYLEKLNQVQDSHPSLELSNIQNQPYANKLVKNDVQSDHMMHHRVNEFEDDRNEAQNQNEEEKYVRIDFDRNNDDSYSQVWR